MYIDKIILVIVFGFFILKISAQETQQNIKKWELSGYFKSLQGIYSLRNEAVDETTVATDAFLHSRLNFVYYPTDKITFKAELRTRFFYGELSKPPLAINFRENLYKTVNDVVDLQVISTGEEVVLHSVFDRLYLEYILKNLEIRAGRQRINWGVHTIWNPNDIFNAFSFTDFDHVERPGSESIRIKYYIGATSSIEVAAKAFNNSNDIIAGIIWKTNNNGYDFQFLSGWVNEDIAIGIGWSGGIKKIGFDGEATFFKATKDNEEDIFSGTIGLDYSFKNNTLIETGLLYNSGGSDDSSTILGFELNAKNLYPYNWTTYINLAKPFTPIFSGAIVILYSPVSGQPIFMNPTLSYSLGENLDVDLIGQIIFEDSPTRIYHSPTQIVYLRMSWNF
ncbi:hypothetical protein NBT05_09345 [Aquimarina sp. ERC-38]|uniref:hypothetical protein n=1 Tax=Aquimarina sp. ERC-38 TaxID=2949996 RepID=UPI002245B8B5|nr:hypothetical protein [Aquimarina sp. ERC-38]UZO79174.1 hypothetical protein NBT05_09345 [Aquimarina sp. ERC-38]